MRVHVTTLLLVGALLVAPAIASAKPRVTQGKAIAYALSLQDQLETVMQGPGWNEGASVVVDASKGGVDCAQPARNTVKCTLVAVGVETYTDLTQAPVAGVATYDYRCEARVKIGLGLPGRLEGRGLSWKLLRKIACFYDPQGA